MLIAKSGAYEATRISQIPVPIVKMDTVKDGSREVVGNMIEPDAVSILLFPRSRSIVLIESPSE